MTEKIFVLRHNECSVISSWWFAFLGSFIADRHISPGPISSILPSTRTGLVSAGFIDEITGIITYIKPTHNDDRPADVEVR